MTAAVVIGAGSIGLRHARVLTGLGHDVALVTARDDLDDARTFATTAAAITAHAPAYVVVATETSRHAASIRELADAGFTGSVLVEKPLAVDVATLEAAAFARVGVAFNLRFHPVVRALADALAGRRVLTVEAACGQHLSTWRPARAVADQYSAHRDQGGGVLRDLSHELDYLAALFGPCVGVFARGGRLGDVTVDSDDAWGIVAEHRHAPLVTVQLNYFDIRPRRRIVVNTGDATFEGDLVAGTLAIDGEVTSYPLEADGTYRDLHAAMLGDGIGVATPADAGAVDDLIAAIERSAETRGWVAA